MTPGTDNIVGLIVEAARAYPERIALRAEDAELTWAQLADAVGRAAAGLRERGLAPGDRFALAVPNGIDFAVGYFAALAADLVAAPLNPGYSGEELAALVTASGAGLVLAPADVAGVPHVAGYRELLGEAAGEIAPERGGEDLAVLLHTSGTSGRPRGVMLSHRAMLANVEQLAALDPAPMTGEDVVLLALPLSHAYGLGPGLHAVARHGATGVLVPRFDPAATLELVESAAVTCVLGVPAMYQAWVAQPGFAEKTRAVRLAVCGAAGLPPSVRERIMAAGPTVAEGYGLTEAGPVVTSALASPATVAGSVGRPLPGVELRLMGADDLPLEPADFEADENASPGTDPGEIVVRGPNLFSGYWPDGSGGPDPDGWWRTGDIGYLDADGELFLVDRLAELIEVSGFHVYPREVEAVLCEHPGVAEAAVVGVPDERTGRAVLAYVVPRGELTEAELRAYCDRALVAFKRPVRLVFVAHLPHSATGKVRKSDLVEDV